MDLREIIESVAIISSELTKLDYAVRDNPESRRTVLAVLEQGVRGTRYKVFERRYPSHEVFTGGPRSGQPYEPPNSVDLCSSCGGPKDAQTFCLRCERL